MFYRPFPHQSGRGTAWRRWYTHYGLTAHALPIVRGTNGKFSGVKDTLPALYLVITYDQQSLLFAESLFRSFIHYMVIAINVPALLP